MFLSVIIVAVYTLLSSTATNSANDTRRARIEWDVDPLTSKSIHQWERTLKETGTLVSETGKYILKFCDIEDTVDHAQDSFCRSPDNSTSQTNNVIPFC
ncbi:uncharacterized protein TNCV_3593351 [Trichonephila clavipes]|nr:uncharacterized protein TNCV_3593351 [Trichonephila clavipes]